MTMRSVTGSLVVVATLGLLCGADGGALPPWDRGIHDRQGRPDVRGGGLWSEILVQAVQRRVAPW